MLLIAQMFGDEYDSATLPDTFFDGFRFDGSLLSGKYTSRAYHGVPSGNTCTVCMVASASTQTYT
jgi:hypothetical protein